MSILYRSISIVSVRYITQIWKGKEDYGLNNVHASKIFMKQAEEKKKMFPFSGLPVVWG